MIKDVIRVIKPDENGKTRWTYIVNYDGRSVRYSDNKNLPMTVLNYVLEAECETEYVKNCPQPYKLETYRK